MKKYFFNVFAAGVLATQAMGMGYNQDEALMDACLSMDIKAFPEDEISDVVLDHVEFEEEQA